MWSPQPRASPVIAGAVAIGLPVVLLNIDQPRNPMLSREMFDHGIGLGNRCPTWTTARQLEDQLALRSSSEAGSPWS